MIDYRLVHPGATIAYRLLPKDSPTNPNKVWRAKVIRCDEHSIFVAMDEPDYKGLTEYITYGQVIGVTPSA
jgi:hypothetical protein